MRKRKFVFVDFAFFDRTGIQKFLEKNALQGWMLKDATGLFWKFERIEPKKLHFSVVYFPDEKTENCFADERRKDFISYCRHSGWELAASRNSMLILYHTSDHPVPIDTDPVLELETIHKAAKAEHLPLRYINVIGGLLFLLLYGFFIFSGRIQKLVNGFSFYYGIYEIVTGILGGYELILYYRWRKRAAIAAQLDGSFLESKSYPVVNVVLRISVFMFYLIWVAAVTNIPIFYVTIGMSISTLCCWALRELMRSRNVDSTGEEKSSFRLMLELTAIFTMIILIFVIFAVFLGSIVVHIYQIEG